MQNISLPVRIIRNAAIEAAYQEEAARKDVVKATKRTGLNSKTTVQAHKKAAQAGELARSLARKVN